MKRILVITILIACIVAISGLQGIAQNPYAKVTVYTNLQQAVNGTLDLREVSQNQLISSMYTNAE